MTEPYIEMPEFVSWVVVAEIGPYYLTLEWKRGETPPQLRQHVAKVRAARERFEIIQQEEPGKDMDGVSLLVSDRRGREDDRWVSMQRIQSAMWDPAGAWNDYAH